MLQVKFRRDSRQRLSSVFASGHADAAIEGDDLVCAAASAILQAAELGLTVYSNLQQSAVTRKAGEDASVPKYATHLVYLTKANNDFEIEQIGRAHV